MKNPRNEGWSFIETLVVVSLIGIALTLAVPSWKDSKSKRQMVGAAETLSSFLSAGGSLAVKRNRNVAVSLVRNDSANWCVGMSDRGSACDCTIEDIASEGFCAVGRVRQILHRDDLSEVALTSHAADTTFVFDGTRGTLVSSDLETAHYFNLQSSDDRIGVQVGVSPTGRVFICNWLESENATPYKSCESTGQDSELPASNGALNTG